MTFVTASYLCATIAYSILAVLLLVGWRGHLLAPRLVLAAVATAVWSASIAFSARDGHAVFLWVYLAEIVRDGAWLAVLTSLARASLSRPMAMAIHAVWMSLLAVGVLWPLLRQLGWFDGVGGLLLSRSGLVLALIGLVLLEQIYRNATAQAQRALRYLAIGVGSLFAYDLFLYAQAELLRGIDANAWAARGAAAALSVPFIALAIRRSPDWSLDIFVSRHVVFYTSVFVAVGSYLLLMALGGYYVRAMGGSWGGIAQLFFFAGAAVVLATFLLSGSLRRRLMVFISKHFYRNKYDYRIEWLRFIQTLSSPTDSDIRRTSLRAVVQILSSPGGVLFTLDETGKTFRLSAVWPQSIRDTVAVQSVDCDDELVRFLIERQWIVDIAEYRQAPDRYQNIVLPKWATASKEWRIVTPLLELDQLVGFVLLEAPPPPFDLTYEDRDLLKTVGRHVATYLAQQDASRKLAESRQFEAYSRLVAFMMHDLKNLAAQLSLIVANAARHKRNPEFIDDAIGTIGNATERMTRLIDQLQSGSSNELGRRTALRGVVEKAVSRCAGRQPVPSVRLPNSELFVVADPERLGMVVEHAIRNAQDASAADDELHVTLEETDNRATILVQDAGCGMTPEFIRDRLFRPFDSTKGSKGMGIGAYQVREYVHLLGGEVDVQSTPGPSPDQGTRFRMRLPLVNEPMRVSDVDDSDKATERLSEAATVGTQKERSANKLADNAGTPTDVAHSAVLAADNR